MWEKGPQRSNTWWDLHRSSLLGTLQGDCSWNLVFNLWWLHHWRRIHLTTTFLRHRRSFSDAQLKLGSPRMPSPRHDILNPSTDDYGRTQNCLWQGSSHDSVEPSTEEEICCQLCQKLKTPKEGKEEGGAGTSGCEGAWMPSLGRRKDNWCSGTTLDPM